MFWFWTFWTVTKNWNSKLNAYFHTPLLYYHKTTQISLANTVQSPYCHCITMRMMLTNITNKDKQYHHHSRIFQMQSYFFHNNIIEAWQSTREKNMTYWMLLPIKCHPNNYVTTSYLRSTKLLPQSEETPLHIMAQQHCVSNSIAQHSNHKVPQIWLNSAVALP